MAILTRIRGLSARLRDESGAAAVEFAIVVPVLLLVVFGVIDFGRAFWTINVATAALREGARVGAVQPTCTNPSTAARDSATVYVQRALNGAFTSASVYARCETSTGLVTVCLGTAQACTNSYPFTPTAPLVSRLNVTNLSVPPAVFRWERAG